MLPGETVSIHSSTHSSSFNVKVYRVSETDILVAEYINLAGKFYPTPENAWRNGAQWPSAIDIIIPETWKSGIYLVKLKTNDSTAILNFVVRTAKTASNSKILHLDNATTQMAYNNWGGKSLYTFNSTENRKSNSVSRLRPGRHGSTVKEIYFARWAAHMGIKLDSASMFDLHDDELLLENYQTLVITAT